MRKIKVGESITGSYRLPDESNFLAADDLPSDENKTIALTITNATKEVVTSPTNQQREKVCLHFEETSKILALNKTNARSISRVLKNEIKNWFGAKIYIYRTTTKAFGNDQLPCIRIKNVEVQK